MTGVFAVNSHVDDGSDAVTVVVIDPKLFHELGVSGGDGMAVYPCGNSVAADFFNIGNAAAVELFSLSSLEALADGVGGRTFCQGCKLQQLFIFHFIMVNAGHFKHTLGQSAGLVKYDAVCIGEGLQVVGALNEDSLLAGTADSGKEAEGNTDDQCTGAAYNQEG